MTFRVLSFDGGGIRGVMSAVMLQAIEKEIGQPLNKYFDLIAGTSTGSILATAIAMGKTSQEIIKLYQDNGQRIFPYSSLFSWDRLALIMKYGISAPKYSDDGLTKVLKEQFGNRRLSDLESPKLLLVAYDTLTREPLVFKNWQKDKPWANSPLWELCLCSSSAPSFFPGHRLETPTQVYSVIDGGVGANNPCACAIAEALRLGNQIKDMTVLSIGTGDARKPITWAEASGWGIGQWIWKGRLIQVLFEASSGIHNYISQEVMSPPEIDGNAQSSRYLRLQPEIQNDTMDDGTPANIEKLIQTGQKYIQENKAQVLNFLKVSNSLPE
jgi:patatin-like phospholipase/acyl hydrolase